MSRGKGKERENYLKKHPDFWSNLAESINNRALTKQKSFMTAIIILTMLVERLFVPSTCLQGSEIAAHLLWPKEKEVIIRVTVPSSLEIFDINNGTEIRKDDEKTYVFDGFDVNGFLGLIFQSKVLETPSKTDRIVFKISDNEGNYEEEEKFIHLFRPAVELVSMPDDIVVKYENDHEATRLNEKIKVSNLGEGLALIGIKADPDSSIQLSEPKGMYEFWTSVWSDIKQKMGKTTIEYPQYKKQIQDYLTLGDFIVTNMPNILDEQIIKENIGVMDALENILASDNIFAEEFAHAIGTAYLKNLHFITNLESFLSYLQTIESNKVLMINALAVINIKRDPQLFKGDIAIFDLNGTAYAPIRFQLLISANSPCELPLHSLIDVIQSGGD